MLQRFKVTILYNTTLYIIYFQNFIIFDKYYNTLEIAQCIKEKEFLKGGQHSQSF